MLDWTNVERIVSDVIAIRPVYTDTGKATEVMTKSGEIWWDKRDVRSVKRALFRCCLMDPEAQRTLVKELLGRELALPFFLAPDRVFIPLKMRQPQVESDAAYGYVDLSHIASIEPTPENRCRLTLKNGLAIELLCTHDTAIKSKEAGLKLSESLQEKTEPNRELESLVLSSAAGLIHLMLEMRQALQSIARKLGA